MAVWNMHKLTCMRYKYAVSPNHNIIMAKPPNLSPPNFLTILGGYAKHGDTSRFNYIHSQNFAVREPTTIYGGTTSRELGTALHKYIIAMITETNRHLVCVLTVTWL